MPIRSSPEVSFILATHNRREVVQDTLARLDRCGLDRADFEVIVVDNASSDGTPDAIAPRVDILMRLHTNRGSCAKALGIPEAAGRFVVFLDDDSSPRPGSVRRMITRFDEDPDLGAAGFSVHLPNGEKEGAALPDVFVGCGVGFRTHALREVGGLDRSFFMQAEEYDLSFRLAGAGWKVRVVADLAVDHLKTPRARRSDRTAFCDTRNNLRVAARYLPRPYYQVYAADWLQRYAWFAEQDGTVASFKRGARAGRYRGLLERWTHRRRRLGPDLLERFFCWGTIHRNMAALVDSGVRRIVLADLGKNVYPFVRAARSLGLQISAIGDDRFGGCQYQYRGIPVDSLADVLQSEPQAVVVANTGPVHAARIRNLVRDRCGLPVYAWLAEDAPVEPTRRAEIETDGTGPNADEDAGMRLRVPAMT